MEEQIKQIKCSLEDHKEIDAISFCPECKLYMCNKCQNFHSSPFFKNHYPYNLNKEGEIYWILHGKKPFNEIRILLQRS